MTDRRYVFLDPDGMADGWFYEPFPSRGEGGLAVL
ncbi:hypothetical protein FHU30_001944 [Actinomadura rupiterrae]|nr:hypothetical protein [Actinomadura rupiterrae]